jgi:hypothetical protein
MKNEIDAKPKSIVESHGDNSFTLHLKGDELKSVFGTKDLVLINKLIQNTTSLKFVRGNISNKDILSVHDLFKNLKPADEIEAILISQIVSADSFANEFQKRALSPEQTVFGIDANTARYSKGINSMCRLIDTLIRYKRGGLQKVIVEHVTVTNGSQAIIGNVVKS